MNDTYARNMSNNQKYWFSWMATLWNKNNLNEIFNNSNITNLSAENSEIYLYNYMKKNNKQMLSIKSNCKNIIEYMGIGAISGGIVTNNYIEYLKKENIPIQVYEYDCIYDRNRKDLHKYNEKDEYYIGSQQTRIRKDKNNI